MNEILNVGIDVGSTTVKAVVVDATGAIIWKAYQRHNTRQIQLVRSFLSQIAEKYAHASLCIFITGSGGRVLAPTINARYIQEVNAVSYAVEKLYPDAGAVIELGGQDAKIIIWKEDDNGRKSTLTFMNDKCAGGTGATIDKIFGKIGIDHNQASKVRLANNTIHHIAAKCGVFAETDVVGLVKNGIDKEEIVASLCTAISLQNLEVLVRGNVLRDKVLLLGGPHAYLPVFADIWREKIPETWKLHGWTPTNSSLEELIFVPDDSQYFAAIGAVFFGTESESLLPHSKWIKHDNIFIDFDELDKYTNKGRLKQMLDSGAVKKGLLQPGESYDEFVAQYGIPGFHAPKFETGDTVSCTLGIDGGSTSSKLALVNEKGELVYKDYILSRGNPIADVREMFVSMQKWMQEQQITLKIIGTAVTGYASQILKTALSLDVAVVETVAHMKSAVHIYGDVDVICDVGGQDIKVLFMKHERVVDFKLNTQCSAGNGYFLQSMAEQFNIPVEQYAEYAFRAEKAPAFNYGCSVFMEQDRVNFQQLGWTNEEIMAGLALVLPLNIWNYVVQEPHIARYGTRFVLQGGTQKNLAAVKAQVDYIKSKVPNAQVHIHKYADVGGAVGAALEAAEYMKGREKSIFKGIERLVNIEFTTRSDNTTRCEFCNNNCSRTFVDITTPGEDTIRFISGFGCERGNSESKEQMKTEEVQRNKMRTQYPNLVNLSAKTVFGTYEYEPMPAAGSSIDAIHEQKGLNNQSKRTDGFRRSSEKAISERSQMLVGMPKLLNLYLYGPFFSTYFRALGVKDVIWSNYTSAKLWEEGNKWGAIDPCFPAKVAPAHIWNLIQKKELTHICSPMITHLESAVKNTMGNNACVIQMGTTEVTEAVFTRDINMFEKNNKEYWKPLVRMDRPIESEGLLFEYFANRLHITEDENAWAVKQAYAAQRAYHNDLQSRGADLINSLIENDRIGIVVLGHPYHHDPGLNHGILDEFQMRGFPILCIESLPDNTEFLASLYSDDEVHDGFHDINDVWNSNFNRNTNLKLWAAKIAARHPNIAVIDLSSFKCGHDAPTYSYISNILDASKTPHFLFHDIDQNKPKSSIAIRIQTIEYFLRLEEEKLKYKVKNISI